MKLKELSEHLKTLPQDLPVMELWDEGGIYLDKEKLSQVIEVVKSKNPLSHGEEWVKYEDFDADYEIFERRKIIALDGAGL